MCPQLGKPLLLVTSAPSILATSKISRSILILPGLTRKKEIDHIEKQFAKLSIKRPWLISKIETEESYKNLDNILEVSHGIIISRRDLALSVNPATVPMMSKEILYKCNENHKLSFLEGELLSFAKLASTPTRSEVSDLANAIIDGVDSVIVQNPQHLDQRMRSRRTETKPYRSTRELFMTSKKTIASL